MTVPADAVRPPVTDAEWQQWHSLAVDVFWEEPERTARLAALEAQPPGPDEWLGDLCRGIWRDGQLVARYVVPSRRLHVGPARLDCGCIGAVCSSREARGQGFGAALMWDAIEIARQRRWPMLLLAGIANFYRQFGYRTCFDRSYRQIEREEIAALADSGQVAVRLAGPGDAAAMLTLFQQAFDGRAGCFDRDLGRQAHLISEDESRVWLLATRPTGQPVGYALIRTGEAAHDAIEVAVTCREAVTALLRAHARSAEEQGAKDSELSWAVPEASCLTDWLRQVVTTNTASQSDPQAGWQARVGHVEAWFEAMLPAWAARWRGRAPLDIALRIGDEVYGLGLSDDFAHRQSPRGPAVSVDPLAIAPLTFGYRRPSWLADEGLVEAADDGLQWLEWLFPLGGAYIAQTDDF